MAMINEETARHLIDERDAEIARLRHELEVALQTVRDREGNMRQHNARITKRQESITRREEELARKQRADMDELTAEKFQTVIEQRDKARKECRDLKARLKIARDLVRNGADAKLRSLASDMWHELNYTSIRAEDGTNGCLERMADFDERMEELGLLEGE